MKVKSLFVLFILSLSLSAQAETDKNKECVIFLHGVSMPAFSMRHLEKPFKRRGYITTKTKFSSFTNSVYKITDKHLQKSIKYCRKKGAEKIHFVGYSLGGVIIRHFLSNYELAEDIKKGRAVVMGSAAKVSRTAADVSKKMKKNWLVTFIKGRAGKDFDTIHLTYKSLGDKVGVISGSGGGQYSDDLEGEDDGYVRVDDAAFETETNRLVVPYGHLKLYRADDVIESTLFFIENGKF